LKEHSMMGKLKHQSPPTKPVSLEKFHNRDTLLHKF